MAIRLLKIKIGMELGQTALATKMGDVRIIKVNEIISNMAVPSGGRRTKSLTGGVCITLSISPFYSYKFVDNCKICKCHDTER